MSDQFSYRTLHHWSQTQDPVFIVGPERSGTSMVFRTLVSHPAFCSFSKATVETFCFIRPHVLFKPASPANYEMRVYLGKQFPAFESAVHPLRLINDVCDQSDLPISYLNERRKVVWNRRNYRDLLRAFFYFSWLNLGERRLAEKTPAHVRAIPEILDCFPKAQILICLRDPLEIIASHRKRLASELGLGKSSDDPSLDWLSKSCEHYLAYFKHVSQLVGNAQRAHSNRVMLVPYHRITTDPDFLRALFSFIGEDRDRLQSAPGEVAADTALNWDPLLASLPRENRIELQDWLSPDEVEIVQTACQGTELATWGMA